MSRLMFSTLQCIASVRICYKGKGNFYTFQPNSFIANFCNPYNFFQQVTENNSHVNYKYVTYLFCTSCMTLPGFLYQYDQILKCFENCIMIFHHLSGMYNCNQLFVLPNQISKGISEVCFHYYIIIACVEWKWCIDYWQQFLLINNTKPLYFKWIEGVPTLNYQHIRKRTVLPFKFLNPLVLVGPLFNGFQCPVHT